MEEKFSRGARRRARHCAVQALYQWHLSGSDIHELEAQFVTWQDMRKVDLAYFQELLRQIADKADDLDRELVPLLDRPLRDLDPVERAILRIGAYEMEFRPDVPYRVIINEAVDSAKAFGAEQSHRYINGVLDKLSRSARAAERRQLP